MAEIFLVPYGGLGNQFFQIAAALSLSQGSKVTVLSDWGYARKDQKNQLEINSYEWGEQVDYATSPKVGLFTKRILNLLLRLGVERKILILRLFELLLSPYFSLLLMRCVRIRVNHGLGFSDMKINKNTLLIGYFQCSEHFFNVKDKMKEICPRNISAKTESLLSEIMAKETLVVHIRRGDYVNEPFGILEDSFYNSAIQRIKPNHYRQIWIFSDDILAAKKMSFFSSLDSIRFVDDKNLSSAEILEVMRYGSSFVIANSSFSWWAAQLRYKADAEVVCPSPWFKFVESPKGIVLSDWHIVQW